MTRCDRLRLVLDYRKKYLDLLLRGGEEKAKQAKANYERVGTLAATCLLILTAKCPTA